MRTYTIRELQSEELHEATKLISGVFEKFIVPGWSEEGVQHFYEFTDPEVVRKRLAENSFILAACHEEQIIGVIEICNYSHIALLFTSEDWHGCGIAGKLLNTAINRCYEEGKELNQITVNSSPYAVTIYERLGFTISNEEQIVNGIRFTPMVKILDERQAC